MPRGEGAGPLDIFGGDQSVGQLRGAKHRRGFLRSAAWTEGLPPPPNTDTLGRGKGFVLLKGVVCVTEVVEE